jgi:hypothetical protein
MRMLSSVLLAAAVLGAADAVWAGTVVSRESDKYFLKGGRMTRYDGQFETTYDVDLEKGTVRRVRLYDFNAKQIVPDDTVYTIEKDLLSTPGKHNRYILPPVVRAVGKPDADSVEILMIEETAVTVARSTSNELIVSHGRRLN